MSNLAALEALLVGPYRWTATTYTSFIRDAYNIIKPEMDRLHDLQTGQNTNNVDLANEIESNWRTSSYDTELAQFVEELTRDSNLVLGDRSWEDILGTDHWNILKLDEKGKDRYRLVNKKDETAVSKKKSVVPLFNIVRDKIEHIQKLSEDKKRKLNYFFERDTKGRLQYSENKFVSFWISKFPKLMPYLWLKFYRFKKELKSYYPDYEIDISRLEEFLLDLNGMDKELHNALVYDMENGNLLF